MTRRSRIVGFGSAGLLVVSGAVSATAVGGGLGEILALVLISLGCVEAVSLVFLEVGLSEDQERAREEADRRREHASDQSRDGASIGLKHSGGPGRLGHPRLDRIRSRPRRPQ